MKELAISIRKYLALYGKIDENIIKAIESIDRKEFMPESQKEFAYLDQAIAIEQEQTISQPSTVARMLSLLELKEKDNVLEIGTGSGWNAALLGYLVKPGKVLTTEIHEELAKKAKEKLKKAGISNVMITLEDFRKIKGRFGKIIFTAGITLEQETIIEDFAKAHLKPKGILLCPFQSGPLIIFKNEKGRLQKNYTNESYNFVPLIL